MQIYTACNPTVYIKQKQKQCVLSVFRICIREWAKGAMMTFSKAVIIQMIQCGITVLCVASRGKNAGQ